MAFTVPNRPDTTHTDQAEPDKGDFQNLGDRTSGVLTGGEITRTATNTVTVGAITGILLGEYFSISTDTVLNFSQPSSGSLAKFVLVLIQKSGSTFSATVLEGTVANGGESATNALFPDYNISTQMPNSMLLAAVYYAVGATDITSASIVDKRVLVLPQANPTVVTATPGSGVGAIGEIRIDSSMTPGSGETRVYVKTDATTWTLMGAPTAGVSSEEVEDIVGLMFTTNASHSGISAVYDDSGGGIDLTGASSWNLTSSGSTESIGDSETVTINVSSDAEISLSHSSGTITINDEWPRIRTFTHPNGVHGDKPAHYLYSDPWGYGGPNPPTYPAAGVWDDQYMYSKLIVADLLPNTNNAWTNGSWAYRWNYVYCRTLGYQYLSNLSDRDLKQDFGPVPGLTFVNGLTPTSFTYKDTPSQDRWGLVAQDIEDVMDTQGITNNSLVIIDEGGLRNLNYVDLLAPVIRAIQELSTRVEALENG